MLQNLASTILKHLAYCDSATCDMHTSFNPDMAKEGHSEKVFEYLMKPLGKGHHIFANRFYTTYLMITYLNSKHFYYTGMLNQNPMNFPPEIKAKQGKKLQHHRECKFYRSSSGILLCQWQDKTGKKTVIAVSTKYTKGEGVTGRHGNVTIKPSIIHQYNLFMNGCDHMD